MVFGRKKSKRTFRQRVQEFWDWFPTIAGRYGELLQNQQGDQVVPEMNEQMEALLPSLSWVFGNEQEGHSFTLTGEGQIGKQLLTEFWLSQSVDVAGWTFFGSRQPSAPESLKDMAIGISEQEQVDAKTFLIRTAVDDEAEIIHITAWHPAFEQLDEEHHAPILFIFLDEALGEFGTQTWLGEIDIAPVTAGNDTRSLADLPQFIESVSRYHEWEKLSPLESYTGYEIREPSNSPRGDTLFGTTCVPYLIFEFLENDGRLPEDPLEGTGAEFTYIAVDGSVFPDGEQVDVRSNIEDTIDDVLRTQSAGRSLGGAFGIDESYIEFLLFDGENSRRIIQDTLTELQLTGRSRIESFA